MNNKSLRKNAIYYTGQNMHLCILLIVQILLGFFVFYYTDISDTLDNCVMLVEATSKGKFLDFYQYCAQNAHPDNVYTANYNVFMYVVFAIWNLPTVIIHMLTDFDYMSSVPSLLWCKGIILVSFAAMSYYLKKIFVLLGQGKEDWKMGIFVMLSSPLLYLGALCASQYDCIMVVAELAGLYYYLKNDNKKFLICFALAVPLKLFSIFIFIPLLAIRYKNVLKILGMIILVYIPNVLLGLPFRGDFYYDMAIKSQNKDALKVLLGTSVTGGVIPVFLVVYGLICIWCYLRKHKSKEEEQYFVIYVCFIVFAAFMALTPIRSYWIVLLVPFLSMLVSLNDDRRDIGLLMEGVASIFAFIYFVINHWIYNTPDLCSKLVISRGKLPKGMEFKYEGVGDLFDEIGAEPFKYVCFGVFVCCLLVIIIKYFPKQNEANNKNNELNDEERKRFAFLRNIIMFSKPAVAIAMTGLMIATIFVKQPSICYGDKEEYKYVDIQELQTVKEKKFDIKFEEERELTEFGVLLNVKDNKRENRSILHFELYNKTTKSTVWEGDFSVCRLEDDEYNILEMDNCLVKPDNDYEMRINSRLTERKGKSVVFLKLNEDIKPAVYFR